MKYRNIIFDWDGTLADTVDIWMTVWLNSYKSAGIDIDQKELIAALAVDWQKSPANFGISDTVGFIKNAIATNLELLVNAKPVRGVTELFEQITGSDRNFYIFSAGIKDVITAWNQKQKYDSHFDLIIDKDSVQNQKPHPEGILKILEHGKLDKKETIMVGDSMSDVKAAKSAGIKSVWIRNDKFAENASLPSYIIDSMDELLNII